jgi:hypothetical protein
MSRSSRSPATITIAIPDAGVKSGSMAIIACPELLRRSRPRPLHTKQRCRKFHCFDSRDAVLLCLGERVLLFFEDEEGPRAHRLNNYAQFQIEIEERDLQAPSNKEQRGVDAALV